MVIKPKEKEVESTLRLQSMPEEIKDSESVPNDRRKVFFGLFVFPMLIAVTMAILLSGIVLLTHEEETPESLITAIKTGAPSKRWQKAYELSNELNKEGGMLRSAGIMNEAIHILNDADHYDTKTRAYMAMALGRFHNEAAHEALKTALSRADDQEDPMLTLFSMWALAGYQNPDDAKGVVRFLNSQHDDLRKTAAYVLGALGDKQVIHELQHSLEDSVVDVRWNAALSLARLGDQSGKEVLLQMLDRTALHSTQQLNESEIERVMVNAAKALSFVLDDQGKKVLEQISKTDPNLKVREAALQSLRGGRKADEAI